MHRFCNCGRWGLHAPCLAWLRRLLPALLLALACEPAFADSPPGCVRLALSFSPDAAAGERIARGETVERTSAAEVSVCDSASVSLPPEAGTLFIDLEAIGAAKDLMAAPAVEAAVPPEGHAPRASDAVAISVAGILGIAFIGVLVALVVLLWRFGGRARVGALLFALALPAAAEAQQLAPGTLTHWCSDRLCSGAGTTRITRTVPAAPCDPWADGVFRETDAIDLACFRQRYGYPHSVAPGSWIGAWCAQHSPCDSIVAQWETTDPRVWTWGGACLEPGSLGRAACDAIHTAGATLGCTMLPCGVVSCPAAPRTCPVVSTGADGYHRGPLLTLPPDRRGPPHTRKVGSQSAGPADACAWIGRQSIPIFNLVRPPNVACCAGMPPECCTPAGFGPQCWEAPEPEPEPDPPAEEPLIDVRLVGCDGEWWKIRGRYRGEAEWMVTAKPGEPAEIRVDGELVFRFEPTAPCVESVECPASEVLDRVRGEVCGEPVAIRQDCLECHPVDGCGGHPSCPRGREVGG